MTTLLLPEIALDALRPLDRAVNGESARLSATDLRNFASVSLILAEGTRKLWEQLYSRLASEGMEGQELRETVKRFRECLELKLRVDARIADHAAQKGEAGKETCAIVEQASAADRELLADVLRLQQVLTRPVAPDLLDKLKKTAAEDSSTFINHDEMVRTLLDGA